LAFGLSLAFFLSVVLPVLGQVSVLTQRYDAARSGANLQESLLTVSNVNVSQFGKLFTRSVDGQIYSQPLYVPNLNISGKIHNVVYVVTMKNNIYAFDADKPDAFRPLWQSNLGNPVPYLETGSADINEFVGITSTPVIDLATNTLYCVAKTKENNAYFHRLHALNITTGQEKFGGPVVIQATIPGTGVGSLNGILSFDPLRHLNRPGLLLLNGIVYLAFGSHGDKPPFHGWIISYDARTLQQVAVFNTTPNAAQGAIWQAGHGLEADENGYIFLMTGNGSFNYSSGGTSLSMSFLKLSTPGLGVVDWFTPYNFSTLNSTDTDLGASGPLLIPGTNLILGGGKEGMFHLLNRSNMGHYLAGSNNQIVQNFRATVGHIHGSPICWDSPDKGPLVYVWAERDYLKAFKLVSGKLQTTPVARSTMKVPNGMPGGMLTLSASSNTLGSGIVWASHPYSGDANGATVPGILRAFDASNVFVELWNSKQNSARDDAGNLAKFCPPVVTNGKVYLATFSNQLMVYGLLSGSSSDTQAPTLPTNLKVSSVTSNSVSLTWTGSTDNVGVTGYQIFRDASPVGTATVNNFTDVTLASGTLYQYSVRAYDAAGNLSQSSNTVSATTNVLSGSGLLVGDLLIPSSTINLTAEGTSDWAHWGLNSATGFDHKASVPQQISNFTELGSRTVNQLTDNPTLFSWSDGLPTASTVNTRTGIFVRGLSNGFQIIVSAKTFSKTLKVYVGLYKGQAKLEATLSDGSAPTYTNTSLNSPSKTSNGVYTLKYKAASSGQTLSVKYTLLSRYDYSGNVTLEAATLAP